MPNVEIPIVIKATAYTRHEYTGKNYMSCEEISSNILNTYKKKQHMGVDKTQYLEFKEYIKKAQNMF